MTSEDDRLQNQINQSRTIDELLSILGPEWSLVEVMTEGYTGFRRLSHAEGYGLSLQWPERDRVSISGTWPVDNARHMHIPSAHDSGQYSRITVNATRPAKAIAAEITRRLLPAYLPVYARMKAQAERANEYAALTARTKAALTDTGLVRLGHRDGDSIYPTADLGIYTMRPQGDTVRFEAFSVPAELAIAILKLANEYTTTKGGGK